MKLLKIGRSSACNIQLHSPNVSSLHAEMILLDDGTIIIEDKNSTNGTYVGNHRIEPGVETQVMRGDKITFGDTELNWASVPHIQTKPGTVAQYSIGSNYRNQIVVTDPFVSRFHATLRIDNKKKAWLTDLGSRNGTIVNGVKIQPNKENEIKFGDDIVLGNKNITAEIAPHLPRKSSIGKVLAIVGGLVAVLAIVVGAGLFFWLNRQKPVVPPEVARQAVVFVTAEYTLTAKLEDQPIAPEIWVDVIRQAFPNNAAVYPGELPFDTRPYVATAFFVDREGRLATNRHVAKPWDLSYMSNDEEESVRSAIDRYVSDQQLPERVNSLQEFNDYYELASMSPRFALLRMVYLQTIKRIKDGENDPVGYLNTLLRQLRKSKVTVTGHLNEINIGYAGRNYSHMDEFERCTVLSVYPTDDVDLALIQLNSKKTPEDIPFVFSPDNFYTGDLKPNAEKLTWIGYPRGAAWALDNKTQSLEPTIRETTVAKMPSKYNFEFQGEVLGGASGSPIYNPENGGQLVGVLWGGRAAGNTFGMAVLAKYLKKMYYEEVGDPAEK